MSPKALFMKIEIKSKEFLVYNFDDVTSSLTK